MGHFGCRQAFHALLPAAHEEHKREADEKDGADHGKSVIERNDDRLLADNEDQAKPCRRLVPTYTAESPLVINSRKGYHSRGSGSYNRLIRSERQRI